MIPSFTSRPERRAVCSNPRRKLLTPVAERLSAMDMVVNKMHFRNHMDSGVKKPVTLMIALIWKGWVFVIIGLVCPQLQLYLYGLMRYY